MHALVATRHELASRLTDPVLEQFEDRGRERRNSIEAKARTNLVAISLAAAIATALFGLLSEPASHVARPASALSGQIGYAAILLGWIYFISGGFFAFEVLDVRKVWAPAPPDHLHLDDVGLRATRLFYLAACGQSHAAFGGRCIPAETCRFAALIVALRSKYTRYSSLARLVSRAPRPHRENWPASALTPLYPQAARAESANRPDHDQRTCSELCRHPQWDHRFCGRYGRDCDTGVPLTGVVGQWLVPVSRSVLPNSPGRRGGGSGPEPGRRSPTRCRTRRGS